MSNITDALSGLKTQLTASLSVSTSPTIYIHHPDHDSASISLASLPVLILFQMTHVPIVYDKRTFKTGGAKRWEIAALAYLQKAESGPLPVLSSKSAVRTAMGLHDEWFDAMATALDADRTLGGNVLAVGDDGALFRAMVGELSWGSDNYWGIEFRIPIKEAR